MRIVANPLAVRNSQPQTAQDDLDPGRPDLEELPRRGTILLSTGNPDIRSRTVIVGSPPGTRGLTIVTNSLDAAIVLSRASRLEIYNIGGTVSPITRAQEGDWAVHEMERLHVDVERGVSGGNKHGRGLARRLPPPPPCRRSRWPQANRLSRWPAPTSSASPPSSVRLLEQIDSIAVSGSPSQAALQPFLERGIPITVGGTS